MPRSLEVSVIIPVYNGVAYVCDAVDSVFAQQGFDVEVIVVDNNSTDGTSALLDSRYGDRIVLLSESAPGAAHARNSGVRKATRAWLAFLDADDVWLPNKLERQFAAWRERPDTDLLFTLVEEFASTVTGAQQEQLAMRPVPYPLLGASSLLLQTSVFRSIGELPPVPHGEFIAWYGWALELGRRELVLPEVLVRRRIHAGNTTRVQSGMGGYPAAMKWLIDRRRERAALATGGSA